MRRVVAHLLRLALAVLVVLGVVLPLAAQRRANEVAWDGVSQNAEVAGQLLAQPAMEACSGSLDAAIDSYLDALHTYALARVQTISYDAREPVSYGPWEAPEELDATEANDEGLLTKWSENYYIAHDWSQYGPQITSIVPGDTVVVNGQTITVKGVFDYPREAYLDEIRVLVGYSAAVLQTCETGTDLNRIVYGDVG